MITDEFGGSSIDRRPSVGAAGLAGIAGKSPACEAHG